MVRASGPIAGLLVVLVSTAMARAGTFPRELVVEAALGPDVRDTGGGVLRERDLLFRLTDSAGVAAYFEELHCRVPVIGRDGRFTVALGTVDPATNPLDADFAEAYWLSVVACEGDAACADPSRPDAGACTGREVLFVPLRAVGYAFRALRADETDYAARAGDCDTLDGLDSSAFMPAGTDLWVDEAGDAMTGPLVLSGAPTVDLHAATKRYVDDAIRAAFPRGYSLLGDTPTPPPGFAYTGQHVLTDGYWRRSSVQLPGAALGAAALGDLVLVACAVGAEADLHAYDPRSDTLVYVDTVPARDYGSMAVVALRDRLHFITSAWAPARHLIFTPSTGTWSPAAPCPTASVEPACVAVGDRIWCVGRDVKIYDPDTDAWTAGSGLVRPRDSVAAAVSAGDVVWALGGNPPFGSDEPQDLVEAHDPRLGGWMEKPRLLAGRHRAAAAHVDGQVYVLGGFAWSDGWGSGSWWGWGRGSGSGGTLQALDVATGQWRELPVSVPTPTWRPAAAALDGKVYLFGGTFGPEYDDPWLPAIDIFTPARTYHVHRKE
jgi:hypothetical protein